MQYQRNGTGQQRLEEQAQSRGLKPKSKKKSSSGGDGQKYLDDDKPTDQPMMVLPQNQVGQVTTQPGYNGTGLQHQPVL